MIFAVTNQKGGVGKTTSVQNIGVYLAINNKSVLLVDADPQANLSSSLGFNTPETRDPSVYDVFTGQNEITEAIKKTSIENLDILTSSIELAGAEVELVSAMSRESILKKALQKVEDKYEYILIDCPPSLGLITINSLVAAKNVIIPVQSEYFALEGLGQLMNTIKLIKNNLNQNLDIGGVILTMFDNRTNLSKDVTKEIKSFFGDKVFNSIIPRNIKLSEAPSHGLSIRDYAPGSTGAVAYESLVGEIIKRFDRGELVRPTFSKS